MQKRNSATSQGEVRPNSSDLRASVFLAVGACQWFLLGRQEIDTIPVLWYLRCSLFQ